MKPTILFPWEDCSDLQGSCFTRADRTGVVYAVVMDHDGFTSDYIVRVSDPKGNKHYFPGQYTKDAAMKLADDLLAKDGWRPLNPNDPLMVLL